MSPVQRYPEIRDEAALRSAVCAELDIPDHPVTVKTSVMRAPTTGQYFITVLEVTTGPLRVHLYKVNKAGRVIPHRLSAE